MPHLTELVSLEIGTVCNLGKVHGGCPNLHPDRTRGIDTSRRLDDATILRVLRALYGEYGFAGFVAFHYYNEPMLDLDRLFALADDIRRHVSQSRLLLWTNGTRIPADCSRMGVFEQIYITDYTADGHPPRNLDALRATRNEANLHVWPGALDQRLTAASHSYQPCVRMFTEIAIDAWGYVHPCCYAWRGMDAIGNIFDEPLSDIVRHWRMARRLTAGTRMEPGCPPICVHCGMRTSRHTYFDPEIAQRARHYAEDIRTIPLERKPGVCFVHYEIPERRLREHFQWNDRLYRDAEAQVYITTDREYEVPDYAHCLIYPKGMPVFSLAATKNHAIRAAILDGCNPILSTDTDIALPGSTWGQFCRLGVNGTGSATIPTYRMVRSHADRDADAPADHGATGVVGMTADAWQRCPYDERFIGYGAEDGQLRLAIARAGIREIRNEYVWHIAHNPDAAQVNIPGHGRSDAWNRDTINPDNFVENRKLIQ